VSDPYSTLRADEYLGPVVETHGELSIGPAEDFFRRFVTSILRQQVSMAAADAMRERLFDAVTVTPTGIRAADEAALRDAGLSEQKTRYVQNVAEAVADRGWSQSYFAGMGDEAIRAELTDVTGVGRWTADMQLIFSLGREDVFPVGDLGIRKGMTRVFDDDLTRAEMVDRAERWAPYRSYASLYLWRTTDDD
jgi:DNA-3-methyladenine glycosylase II